MSVMLAGTASTPFDGGAHVTGKGRSYNCDDGSGSPWRVWHACASLCGPRGFGDTMGTITQSLLACLVAAALPAASAQSAAPSARGELLYSTHCIACHSKEIHWRQKKLATDWASLEAQVRRWAGNAGLGWSDEEIADVARYLNAVDYRFAAPSVTGFGPGASTRSIARTD